MNNEQEEYSEVQIVPSSTPSTESMMLDRAVSTAKSYPRNITRCIQDCISIAIMDEESAAKCSYTLPFRDDKNKPISGPSVYLARIILQNWTNLRAGARVVSDDGKQITSLGLCWDMEKNTFIEIEIKRSVINKLGKRYTDRMISTTSNAANAIALRNALFNVIPASVTDRILKEAKSKVLGDVSDKTKFIARRKQIFDKLKDTYNVTEEEILKSIDRASMDHVTIDDLSDLIGIGTAIKDGETSIDEAFRGVKDNEKEKELTVEDLTALFFEKKPKMDPKTVADATRILGFEGTVPEKNSFKKLYKELLKIK